MNLEPRQQRLAAELQRQVSAGLLDLEQLNAWVEELRALGNLFNEELAGKSGWLFWDTSDKIERIHSQLLRALACEDIDP